MEILLKNGLVFDGSLNKPIIQDIYIKDGKIAKMAKNQTVESAKVIDCSGLNVAPGFIDAHSHNDFFVQGKIQKDAILPFLKQGITTQIVGNCGFSAYGVEKDSLYLTDVGGGLFHVEKPSSLDAFAKAVKDRLCINIVPLIGHGTTRISVAGKKAKDLTKEEKAMQLSLVEEAMQSGAFGGSLGLMYQPGMFAPKEELIDFAKIIKKYDGILTVHPRANSKIALGYPLFGKPHIEQALDEVLDIVKETKVRLEYSHLIFVGKSSWPCVDAMLEKFKQAQADGYDVGYDLYPFSYGASVITVVLPSWYLKLKPTDRKKAFHKLKLKIIINMTKKLLGIDFDDMTISYIGKDYPQYEGKTVADIAKEEGINPIDMYLKLVDLSLGKGRIMFGKYYNDAIIETLMKDAMSIYMTDAWYEESGTQNAGAFQAFPLFIKKAEALGIPLEETIHKMTGATSDRFKIDNRGYLKEGYYADITIFDDKKIAIDLDKPDQTPLGMHHVIINGIPVIKDGKYANVTVGQLILKPDCR